MANGQTVLTRNVREFDVMNEIMPDGSVLFYDQVASTNAGRDLPNPATQAKPPEKETGA